MALLPIDQLEAQLAKELPNWTYDHHQKRIRREFKFKDFYHTISFVNALAFYANKHNHHPDLEVGYNYCNVNYSTHDAGGITDQDFRCAKEAEGLA